MEFKQTHLYLREWLILAVIGGVILTCFDAVLLQKKHNYFTGGFLSYYHLNSSYDAIGFFLISLLVDISLMGILVGFGIWLFGFRNFTPWIRGNWILVIGLSPMVVANFISYKLFDYLGDAFELSVVFDLIGRDPLEILAVGFPYLYPLVLIIMGMVAIGIIFAYSIKKLFLKSINPGSAQVPFGKWVVISAVILTLGITSSTFARLSHEGFDNGLKRKPSGKFFGFFSESLTDFDRDGYGLIKRPPDPAPFDKGVYPYAVDFPGNGIDENGIGGDLPTGALINLENSNSIGTWEYKPHIIFFMLESFRADVIGSTYNGKRVTPVLDNLGFHGISSNHTFSHNGFTPQSRLHTFSGSLSGNKGVTLVDDFKNNGYQVAYFSAQDESFGGPKTSVGFERADISYDGRSEPHQRFTTFSTPGSIGLPLNVLKEKVGTFLETRDAQKPLFLYINLYDTHFPYHHTGIEPFLNDIVLKPSLIKPARLTDLYAMYLNTVSNIDHAIGEILEKVRIHVGNEMGVIVTADHGESLFDEGFLGHGYLLNDSQTRIPLIVNGLPMVIEEPFGQSELRESIIKSLESNQYPRKKPMIIKNLDKSVFQYLGKINRPRQIAQKSMTHQTVFDFRSGRVKIESGNWKNPKTINSEEMIVFKKLIYFWENIILIQKERVETSDELL